MHEADIERLATLSFVTD